MYNHFFGFQERPFKLVPNPAYLYLSKSHEEALAHLNYAVTDGEGFVEITGDVGTGKTLLCRTFLENLGPDIDFAYIFNPRMDALDLLRAINDEFGVAAHHDSKKALVDALNIFLMEKKAQGRRVILLIDEAQNLSKDVLEQIRLLSNLETTKEKLLQIILVGQPELSEMLDSYELRQLGQRISLSCRLAALNFDETRQYIAHRIAVAAQKPSDIFSNAAIRRIYRFSRGVPRLINIACDRALLTAYGQNQRRVTGRTARTALLELATRGEINRETVGSGGKRVLALAALCAALAAVLFFYQADVGGYFSQMVASNRAGASSPASRKPPQKQPEKPIQDLSKGPLPGTVPLPAANLPGETKTGVSASVAPLKSMVNFQEQLMSARPASQETAFVNLLKCWGIDPKAQFGIDEIPNEIQDDMTFFTLAARQNGLTAMAVDQNLNRVAALNLPAILKLYHPLGRRPVYALLEKASSNAMTLVLDESGQPAEASIPEIMAHWDGKAFVFWKNFYNYSTLITFSAQEESIIALKLHLRDIGYTDIGINGIFDRETQSIVKEIQARHGIPVDGFVGALTQIALYNETPHLAIPHLRKPGHLQVGKTTDLQDGENRAEGNP